MVGHANFFYRFLNDAFKQNLIKERKRYNYELVMMSLEESKKK